MNEKPKRKIHWWVICIVLSLVFYSIGHVIGYISCGRNTAVTFLRTQHLAALQMEEQTDAFFTCWEARSDETSEEMLKVTNLIDSAIKGMNAEIFPNFDAIKKLKNAKETIHRSQKITGQECDDLPIEYEMPKLPGVIEMMIDYKWITAEDLGTETILPNY